MTLPDPSRRDLVRWAAATATAGSAILSFGSWGQTRLAVNPFSLGVASGAPSTDGFVLWTRLMAQGGAAMAGQDDIAVRWEVADDAQFTRIVQQGRQVASATLAHSVHVELAGLSPDRWYFYRFHAGDFTSATGRTRTLPLAVAPVAKLRLAYASCQRWEHGYYSAHRHLAQEQLDLVLFLGDYIYEYPGAVNAVRPVTGGWVQNLDDYRARYALHKSDADLQSAHAACPWLFTWDDHEVHNDYAGETAGFASNQEPALAGTFLTRRAHAYQAWYEHMPVRANVLTRALAGLQQGAEMRIFQSLSFGRLANLVLLDPRQYKDPIVCTKDARLGSSTFDAATCAAWRDPKRSFLGRAQEAWLDGKLAQADNTWQILGQGSLLGPRDFKSGPEKLLWNDGWDGYPAARLRLTQSLQHRATSRAGQSAVVLGGDVHENWVGHVKADYDELASAPVAVEFCGTGISSRASNTPRSTVEGWLSENPHFTFADNRAKGYGVCEFTATGLTTHLRAVSDVTRQDASISTLASFGVQPGKARVERLS